jgi:hypothetical protein
LKEITLVGRRREEAVEVGDLEDGEPFVDETTSLSPNSSIKNRDSALSKYTEFYAIAFLIDAGVFLLWPVFDTNVTKQFPVGQNFVYLTQWNGTLQTLYLGLCLFEALFNDTVRFARVYVTPWRHWFYGSIAFPVCNLVSSKVFEF